MIKRLLRMLGLGPDPKLQREPPPERVMRKDRYEHPDFSQDIADLKTKARELNFPDAVREQTLSLEMRAKVDRELSALPRGRSMFDVAPLRICNQPIDDDTLSELTNPTNPFPNTGLPDAYWRAVNNEPRND